MKINDLDNYTNEILLINKLITKIGIPLFDGIYDAIKSNDPTIEQILKLKDTIKDPESYFDEN